MSRIKIIQKYVGYSLLFSLILFPIFFNGSVAAVSTPQSPISSTTLGGSPYDDIYITELNRSLKIQDSAYIVIEDKFQFLNNRSSSLASINIGLNDENMDLLLYYEAKDENLGPLTSKLLDGKVNGSYILEITLNQPLLPFSSVTVNLKSVFNTIYTYYEPELSWYGVDCQILPITPYEILTYTTEVVAPVSSSDISITPEESGQGLGEGAKIFTGNDISPFETKIRNFVYRNYPFETKIRNFVYRNYIISNLKIEQLERTIRINPWGYILVIEEHELINNAKISADILQFAVPSDAKNFSMSDNIGEIMGISEESELDEYGRKIIKVNLRFNRVGINYNATMKYQIKYYLPYNVYMTNNLGTKNLRIDLFPTHMNYIISNQKIKIEIMGASSIDRVNFPETQLIKTSSGIIIERINSQITPFHSQLLDITYKTKFISLFGRATIFSLAFIIILGLYVVMSNKRKEYEESDESFIEQSVPIRELTQFVTLIEERNALLLDIEKADNDLRRKRIQKKVYTKTVRNYQAKLKELGEESIPFKRILIESGGQIQSIIQKLDFLEAEKISVKDSLKLLADRYKRGKLPSKAAYERLSNDMMKQLDSSQKKVEIFFYF